ncbi:MAG: class I SAM-dependent methyltransferase [Mycobacterium sp.]|jgi:arsenite methyltransferase|uniref:class I SAM-dependent methyltransferase n=1 Tax=Mycobacterium sp. TaxID=1785 RepID=UPI0038998BE9
MTVVDLRAHKADYGFDGDYRAVSAPTVATIVGTVSAALLASAARSLVRGKPVVAAAAVTGGTGALIVTTAALFIRTTRVGKFEVWAEILEGLRLRGDETLLDLGCGRGAVLLAAAKLLPKGRAIGVDIWRPDQTDNLQHNTLRNTETEGVADRVEVRTADITELPFGDNSVDVIVSSLVVHNIPTPVARAKAISEAARVLRPGGRLVLADIWAARRHVRQLRELGWTDARRRGLGWRMWWGPGMGTHLITATKPA